MVKGVSKQVIVVQSPDRELFDQAIFILKERNKNMNEIKDIALAPPGHTKINWVKSSLFTTANVSAMYTKAIATFAEIGIRLRIVRL